VHRTASISKNEHFRNLIKQSVNNDVLFDYVLADNWFGSKENLKYIHYLNNSPYAWINSLLNLPSSAIAAIFALITSLYFKAKWFAEARQARASNLQKATIEANIWLAWDLALLVGDFARLAFCLIDLWYTSIFYRFW